MDSALVSKYTLFSGKTLPGEAITQGVPQLNTPIGKTKPKRPSKGQRKHNRLVKQEARKASIPGQDLNKNKNRRPA
jgi:hypothetical protein